MSWMTFQANSSEVYKTTDGGFKMKNTIGKIAFMAIRDDCANIINETERRLQKGYTEDDFENKIEQIIIEVLTALVEKALGKTKQGRKLS